MEILKLQSLLVYTFIVLVIAWLGSHNIVYYKKSASALQSESSLSAINVVLISLFFGIVSGLRYNVGTDWFSYLDIYVYGDLRAVKLEPLFTLLTDYLRSKNLHASFYFGLWAFIQCFFIVLFLKDKKPLIPLVFFFIVTIGEYKMMMNIIRGAIAAYIWLYSVKYIVSRQFYRYLFFCIIAFLFHRASFFLVLFYPLLYKGKDYLTNTKTQLIILGAALVIRFLFAALAPFIEVLIGYYQSIIGFNSYSFDRAIAELDRTSRGTGLAFLFKIVVYVYVIIHSKELKELYNSKLFNIIYFFFFVSVIVLSVFPPQLIVMTRPFLFFTIFQPIMLAYLVLYLIKKAQRTMAYGICVAMAVVFIYSQLTATLRSFALFQFTFQHNINYYPYQFLSF